MPMQRSRTNLLAWFIFSISIFILNESSLIHLNNSYLYSQELQTSIMLKKGNNWIEIKQGDELYVRSYNAKRKPSKLPSSTLGSFTAAKPIKFVGIDFQKKILVTEVDYILLSDIHSISITSSKTMAFRFIGNNFAHGFAIGTLIPLTIFFANDSGENEFILVAFISGFVGVGVGVSSAILGLIHGLTYPNIENEFIVGQNEWIIVEE